jgi:ABC-2 type transport system permease protein
MVLFPISIYDTGVRVFLTFVLPLAFVSFYPAGFLLDRPEYADTMYLVWLSPLVGMGVFALSLFVWARGIAAYSGTGS